MDNTAVYVSAVALESTATNDSSRLPCFPSRDVFLASTLLYEFFFFSLFFLFPPSILSMSA